MTGKWKATAAIVWLLMCVLLAATAGARQIEPWEIDADVDGDGRVAATDVQHVINRALGVTIEATEAVGLPIWWYVVASPRASLTACSVYSTKYDVTVGAAHNFPREDGRLLVRQGSKVDFRLDRNIEGVWYEGACGILCTQLVVEMQDAEGVTETWAEIGTDGAGAHRCGPQIGRADVTVHHRFNEAGRYLVRATVRTAAIPLDTIVEAATAADPSMLYSCAAVERDEVYVTVHVLAPAVEPLPEEIDWLEIPEPALHRWREMMPHDLYDIDALELPGKLQE